MLWALARCNHFSIFDVYSICWPVVLDCYRNFIVVFELGRAGFPAVENGTDQVVRLRTSKALCTTA